MVETCEYCDRKYPNNTKLYQHKQEAHLGPKIVIVNKHKHDTVSGPPKDHQAKKRFRTDDETPDSPKRHKDEIINTDSDDSEISFDLPSVPTHSITDTIPDLPSVPTHPIRDVTPTKIIPTQPSKKKEKKLTTPEG